MKLQKHIEKYNAEDTLILISPYPKKGELHSAGTSGIASYSKNIISPMSRKVIVLTNYIHKPECYEEKNTLVIRCYKLSTPLLWLTILNILLKFTKTKQILVQFDFATYGDSITSSCIIPFLFVLKFFFYNPSIILHGVVNDIRKLAEHVGLTNSKIDRIKAYMYNCVFYLFYRTLSLVTHRIIVLEETLKQKLSHIISSKKIIAIPHGVDGNIEKVSKQSARKKLGIGNDEYVVLFFGFINWFKGADFFASTFRDQKKLLGKKAHFIIAGGESATLKDKNYYQKFYAKVLKDTGRNSAVRVTGYVPQEAIQAYFCAADIVIFPYRHFMMASGVLSLTFSYKKTFVVSSELSEMFHTPDFNHAFQTTGLKYKDFVFNLTKESCATTIEKVLKNGIQEKIATLSEIMSDIRSYKNTARLYEYVLFEENRAPAKAYSVALRTYEK